MQIKQPKRITALVHCVLIVFSTLAENIIPPYPAPQDHGYNTPPALPNLLKKNTVFHIFKDMQDTRFGPISQAQIPKYVGMAVTVTSRR
jgi:hypothetical protein